MRECDCLNWCGDDPGIDKKKAKPCKDLMLARLWNKKPGTSKERAIVATIGRDVIKLGHTLQLCIKQGNRTEAAIIDAKLTYAKTLFKTAKSMLTIKYQSTL